MNDTIVVTGATGKTGRKLVTLLADQDIPVRATIRSTKHIEQLKRPNVETAIIDSSPRSWDQVFRGAGKAFILTPFVEDQAAAAHPIIEAAANAGVRYIVRLSAIAADHAPVEILRQHHQAEKEIEATGIPFTHLRPNFFMENLLGYAGTIKSMNTFFQPTGEAKVSYIDTRDVAAAAARVLTTSGYENKAITLTGGEALSHSEIAAILSRITGRQITYTNVTVDAFRNGLIQAGLQDWMADSFVGLMETQSQGLAEVVTPDVKNITGREPIRMEQFLRENADAFRV